MILTRRRTLELGLAGLAGLATTTVMPFRARAQGEDGDSYETDSGQIVIFPIDHASFVMTVPGLVIYADPVGGAAAYDGHPPAELILVTHEHGDHFDVDTLTALAGEETKLITNPAVFGMLPAELKSKAMAIGNGESAMVGTVEIEAIPAYNTTEDRLQYHPQGRDNGYVLTIDGRRVYIAGDTEDIPEMRALENIHVAFVPMNLPYTMDTTQASSAVAEFAPDFVYPYHYKGQDPEEFAAKVADTGVETKVVQGPWYS